MMKFDFFECEYCETRYSREASLPKHLLKCEKKARWDSFGSKRSQSAFLIFNYWMSHRGFGNRSKREFIESKHYTSFVKFVDYCTKMMVPDRQGFVVFLTKMRLLPSFWTNDDMYREYITDYERLTTPQKQAEISYETVAQLGRILDCEPGEVWAELDFPQTLKLIEAKKLSPWFLFYSSSFDRYLKSRPKREQIVFDSLVDRQKWLTRFRKNPDAVTAIISMLRQMKV